MGQGWWLQVRMADPGPLTSQPEVARGGGGRDQRGQGCWEGGAAVHVARASCALGPAAWEGGKTRERRNGASLGWTEGVRVDRLSRPAWVHCTALEGRGGLVADAVSFTTSALPPARGRRRENQASSPARHGRARQLQQHSALSRQLALAGGPTSVSISWCARRPANSSMQSSSG